MLNEPLPNESATGIEPQPETPVSAMSSRRSPLKSPTMALAPGKLAQVVKLSMVLFTNVNVPLPLESAIGTRPQSAPVSAMSSRPSPSKSPATGTTLAVAAKPGKLATPDEVTVKRPSPFENATGIVPQLGEPVSATSCRPSPSKSPATGFTPGRLAQSGKFATQQRLTSVKLPVPLESAIGIEPQLEGPVNAMSS